MRFQGTLRRNRKFWLAEITMLNALTQGRSRKQALAMIVDWIETMIDRKGFAATIVDATGNSFELAGNDPAALIALLLRRRREAAGLSLAEIAARLGASSRNSYARYERGDAVPSIDKLDALLKATTSGGDYVIREAAPHYGTRRRR